MASRSADNVIIRLATAGDAAPMHGLLEKLAEATGLPQEVSSTPEDLLRHGFGDQPAFQAFIALQGGEALGLCLFFYSFSSWRGALGVYIQDIFVVDEMRGSGLGRRLIAATVKHAAGRGANYLRLSVARSNVAARDFYSRIGLSESADECIYQAAGDAFRLLSEQS